MTVPQFQTLILSWHRSHGRDMPWRKSRDPYRILVSELMLQQTQVARVLLKYGEFLNAFPTLESLASASDKELFRVWQGLGYWKRAKYLKEAAQRILQEYGGTFPRDPAELQKLPGVGHYTARALACFAFNNAEAFLDTNIRRVYLHFFFPRRESVPDKEILRVAQKAVPKGKSREWHYALFDYGATVLKDKSINKRSRHYAKQSAFEGSFRSFRTKVMRFLLDRPNQEATPSRIGRALKESGSPYETEEVLASLVKDGLVKKKGRRYAL